MIKTDLEVDLERLPDLVAKALETWRRLTLDRERTEALLYIEFKGQDKERSATEIKALINAAPLRYAACLEELKAEAEHTRVLEKLLCVKKEASFRTNF